MKRISILIALFLTSAIGNACTQKPGASSGGVGVSVRDSLADSSRAREFLLKLDSIMDAAAAEESATKQVASQREIDIDGDGVPEMFRINGWVDNDIDKTKLEFTIKRGKKLLWKDTWTASNYFEKADHLTRAVKLHRLRKIVNTFFANENFEILDSAGISDMIHGGSIGDVRPGTSTMTDLLLTPKLTFSVLAGREYWYGLAWLPSASKLVRAWRN